MLDQLALAALAFGAGALAQQAGTLTAENHPSMPWSSCTASGCTQQKGTVVLDSNWRWLHSTSGYTNCYTVSPALSLNASPLNANAPSRATVGTRRSAQTAPHARRTVRLMARITAAPMASRLRVAPSASP